MGKPEVIGNFVVGPHTQHWGVWTKSGKPFDLCDSRAEALEVARVANNAWQEANGEPWPIPHPAGEPYKVDGILVDGPDNHKSLWVSADCQCARLNRAFQLGYDKGRAST